MKRFYKRAEAVKTDAGWTVELDGRPLRTPQRHALQLPTEAMARAIAGEWNAQGDIIDPVSMHATGIANAAIDHVAPGRAAFADGLAAYGESDLLCYRAERPAELVERQCRVWDPLLQWAGRRYDIGFEIAEGIIHRPQPEPTLARLRAALDAYDDFALAAAQPLVTISGSLVIALALLENEIDMETAWQAGVLDDNYQTESWGADEEAARSFAARRQTFEAAAAFLRLR